MRLEDAVLDGQVLVPHQKLLVHRPRHVGKDARPNRPCPIVDDGVTGTSQNLYWTPSGTAVRRRLGNWLAGRFSFLTVRGLHPSPPDAYLLARDHGPSTVHPRGSVNRQGQFAT